MILIVSNGQGENDTDEVVKWLNYYNASYVRLNCDELINSTNFEFLITSNSKNEVYLKTTDHQINLDLINVVWCRRGFRRGLIELKTDISGTHRSLKAFYTNEINMILEGVNYYLRDRLWINNYQDLSVNKLRMMMIANEVGLEIPSSYISNNYETLNRLASKIPLITKPVSEVFDIEINSKAYSTFTQKYSEITDKTIFPSLVQEEIAKEYEIRIFYLDGKMWPMGIFSQNNEQTKVDYRNYNASKMNRAQPVKIPNDLEIKIRGLMNRVNLKTGSLDFIKSTDGKYYFLEVNPVGQIGMTSFSCNYHLYEIIAKYLIEKDEKN